MDAVVNFLLNDITPWHWLGLALILLGIEMATSTYDLLWVSAAAFLTAAYSVVPLPAPLDGWQVQVGVFVVSGIVLVIMGRTIFASMREVPDVHPTLNQRGNAMVGRTGVAADDFVGGEGKVKIGDTVWLASAVDGGDISADQSLKVVSVEGTRLTVELV